MGDLGSLLTTALALTPPSEYEGGHFELRQGADQTVHQAVADAGDVIVWRGWDPHRVAHVTKGRRQVLVIEWWLGPPNTDPRVLRGIQAGPSQIAHLRKSFDVAVAVDPLNPIALLNHATHLSEAARRDDEAELGLRRALELGPNLPLGHLKLGKLLKAHGRNTEALQSMYTAARLEPTSADFALVAGVTAVSEGDNEGFVHLQAAAKLAPGKAQTHQTIAAALASANRVSEAKASLSKALELDPTSVEALAL